MASARAIPPSHVGTYSFQHDDGDPDPLEFPELTPQDNSGDEEWELVPKVQFELTDAQQSQKVKKSNPKMLLHSQSSPNLRDYVIEESDSEDDFSEVALSKATQDDASSFSMLSSSPSVNSIWSSRISFKDALLKKDESVQAVPENKSTKHHHHHQPRIKKVKPQFVVATVAPIKHAKSTGDLSTLLEEDILGDTDASDFYARKAHGSLGRKNAKKIRPDEAKRLEMTMNKKNSQRAQGR